MSYKILLLPILIYSCASIVNEKYQEIDVVGGTTSQTVSIKTPQGIYNIDDGYGSFYLHREQKDLPIEITCNGKTKRLTLERHFSWGWGIFGNLIFGGIIGLAIDLNSNRAYNYQSPLILTEHCR